MELIYALMIFFGVMTPSEYSAMSGEKFKTSDVVQVAQQYSTEFNGLTKQEIASRIRAIDRTED